jgi:hypothetical protein
MTDKFLIDNNLMCFKQGNKINEWWVCAKIDVEYIVRLINTIIKNPEKKHKLQFINQKQELSYVEGCLINKTPDDFLKNGSLNDFNIVSYNAGSKNIIRKILIINLPQHNGLSADLNTSDSESEKKNTKTKSSNRQELLPQFSQNTSNITRDKDRKTSSRDRKISQSSKQSNSRNKYEPRSRSNKSSNKKK